MSFKLAVMERTPKVVFQAANKVTSPKVLFAAGVVTTIAGGVLACRATLKLPEVMDEFEGEVEREKDHADARTMTYIYAKHGLEFVKVYAVPVGVTAVGFALLTSSHIKLTRQNEALIAAYTTLNSAYEAYRERVRQELGEKKELELYQEATATDTALADAAAMGEVSEFSKWFTENSQHWQPNSELNKIWVDCQVDYFNRLLRARGYVFLNEVYERFDFPICKEGQVLGWYYEHGGDFRGMDFGVYEHYNKNFLNGKSPDVLLDIRPHGVITHKI